MRPVVGRSALPSYLIYKLVTFWGSRGPGSLLASEKFALSKVTTNSLFSLSGFLKSIAAGLAPTGHLIGPWGWGADDLPNNIALYSIPSVLVSLRIPLLSPIVNGSYLMFTWHSTPLKLSAAGAAIVGAPSSLKSQTPYPSARSILTV